MQPRGRGRNSARHCGIDRLITGSIISVGRAPDIRRQRHLTFPIQDNCKALFRFDTKTIKRAIAPFSHKFRSHGSDQTRADCRTFARANLSQTLIITDLPLDQDFHLTTAWCLAGKHSC